MGSSFWWGRLILHGAKDKGSFKAYASYLRDASDGVTKVIQLAEAKLGSGYLSTGQEDAEAAAGESNYFSAHIRLRELGKSEDKADSGFAVSLKALVGSSEHSIHTSSLFRRGSPMLEPGVTSIPMWD
ncbi:hypothetical protein BHM03_00041448 [Ensete ventricosum]|nr:hypothetical protein BHM03_00041448 [Ensete ventricosum]